jgi:DNA-binding beta-propeller fold protein YncE
MAGWGRKHRGAGETATGRRANGAAARRRILTGLTTGALLAAGAGLSLAQPAGPAGPTLPAQAPAPGPGASRFLTLTGEGTPGALTSASGAARSPAGSATSGTKCANAIPQGWCLTPAGHQVATMRFPLGVAASPDGSHVVVSSDSGGVQGLTVIDTKSLSAVPTLAANLFMGLSVDRAGQIFASGGNANRVFRFRLVGPLAVPLDLTDAAVFPLHGALSPVLKALPGSPGALPVADGIPVGGYPGNSVLSGGVLYVAGTLSEPSGPGADACPSGQAACGRVTVIDAGSGSVLRRIPVGQDAYGLAVDAVHHRLYVSNWADEAGRGGPSGGTVSVVDITDPRSAHEVSHAGVGRSPSAVQLSSDASHLFVANTEDDTISVFTVRPDGSLSPSATEAASPIQGGPVGSHPDAMALSPDGGTLFVALAGMNAIEVRDGHTAAPVAGHPMYIPTGWYPSALAVTGTAAHYRLWVTNAKGSGPGPGYNFSVFANGSRTDGSVSAIDLPAPVAIANGWTAQVAANDQLDRISTDPCQPGGPTPVSQVLCPPPGQSSPIRHVVYLVTENKTFDQYFGDLPPSLGYDADPTYALYGQPVTPNHHALATHYGVGDRFFSDAEVSVTGHSWTSGAIATDHNEKTWEADYDQGVRGTHGNSDPLRGNVTGSAGNLVGKAESVLNDPKGGYVFEAFRRAGAKPPNDSGQGLSMAIYGEHTAAASGDMSAYLAPDWHQGDLTYFDTCRAGMFIHGTTAGGAFPDGSLGPTIPLLTAPSLRDCEKQSVPPTFNLAHWTDVWNKTHTDVMPNFIYMTLPVNHTLGANLGSPTPASMVADNDYAIGLIVQALSHSPFWGSTTVLQTEDDTQLAGDHISPLRDYLVMAGPWTSHAPDHQWGSMPSLLRTVEHLFGVAPVSLNDRLAPLLQGAFLTKLSDKPDLSPYTAVRPVIPFAVNQPGTPGQAASMAMDWSHIDQINEATLNDILYAIQRGTPLNLPANASTAPGPD